MAVKLSAAHTQSRRDEATRRHQRIQCCEASSGIIRIVCTIRASLSKREVAQPHAQVKLAFRAKEIAWNTFEYISSDESFYCELHVPFCAGFLSVSKDTQSVLVDRLVARISTTKSKLLLRCVAEVSEANIVQRHSHRRQPRRGTNPFSRMPFGKCVRFFVYKNKHKYAIHRSGLFFLVSCEAMRV